MFAIVLPVLSLLGLSEAQEKSNLEKLIEHVPGVPGEDYPIFSFAPDTSFLCEIQPVEGYYADPEGDCQLYHVCSDSGDGIYVKFDFLCPNGTIFNQEEFVCDWWFNFDCSTAEELYFLNIEVAEKNAERQRQREAEREQNQEPERQRSELSADQIEDLRNGGERPEQPRSSGPSNTNSRPSVSFNQVRTTRRPKSFNRQPQKKTSSSGNSRNRFGRPTPRTSSQSSSAALKKGNTTTLKLKTTNNGNTGTSSTRGQRRKKKKSKLRKEKSDSSSSNNQSTNFRARPFTNFGNGQSRFGNF